MDKTQKTLTDWKKIRKMKDEDIDYSDNPPLTDEQLATAFDVDFTDPKQVAQLQEMTQNNNKNNKKSIKVEYEVFNYYRKRNKKYENKMNEVLKDYMLSH
jgi:uncharacterized protein (DUF4415 family)